jgi:hypothetical protein
MTETAVLFLLSSMLLRSSLMLLLCEPVLPRAWELSVRVDRQVLHHGPQHVTWLHAV